MVITDIVINTVLGRVTRHPAGMHCPARDDAFVSSYYYYYYYYSSVDCSTRLVALVVCRSHSSRRTSHSVTQNAGLDNTDVKNYRPISNLSVISKLLEHDILRRQLEHLQVNDLLPSVQSAYRKCLSTETAIARVLSDILMALDRGDVAAVYVSLLHYFNHFNEVLDSFTV